jgi:hypothetical protein
MQQHKEIAYLRQQISSQSQQAQYLAPQAKDQENRQLRDEL